jgi:Zn finger protein HypA/HybF involved in hydrogenase expression
LNNPKSAMPLFDSEDLKAVEEKASPKQFIEKEDGIKCSDCGWEGTILDLESGVVSTEGAEAISTKICPNCKSHKENVLK